MKNKNKQPYVDDGHTVFSMEGLESPLHQKKGSAGLTGKERFAAIRAGLAVYLPMLGVAIAAFGIAMLLISFWLK